MNSRWRNIRDLLQIGIPRVTVFAIDQHWDDDPTTLFGQPPRELAFLRHTRRQADELLRSAIGIGQRDHLPDYFSRRLQQQSFAVNARKCGPANGMHHVQICLGNNRGRMWTADIIDIGELDALIDDAKDFLKFCRLGSTERAYASGDDGSGFQNRLRFVDEAANSRSRYLSMPATMRAAKSPFSSSCLVFGNGSARRGEIAASPKQQAANARYRFIVFIFPVTSRPRSSRSSTHRPYSWYLTIHFAGSK